MNLQRFDKREGAASPARRERGSTRARRSVPLHRGGMLAVLASALVLASCATGPETGGAGGPELRFHNWWNYYEYGVQQLRQGAVGPAKLAFEQCLGLKPGAKFGFDEDMWRARTYGLHFIEGFFPNRELGVCLFEQGRTDEAVTFLLKSLKQCPSGRAKRYLNLARKRQLAGVRVAPPAIVLAPESERTWTRDRKRAVAGVVKAAGRVARTAIGKQTEFIELAEESRRFEKPVALVPGPNVVTIEAADLLGQVTTAKVTWILDVRPPELAIKSIDRTGRDWKVEGVCLDDSGLAAVSLGGQRLPAGGPDAPAGNVPVKFTLVPGKPLTFIAEDVAGNQITTVLSQDTLEQPLQGAVGTSGGTLAMVGGEDHDAAPVWQGLCQAGTAANAEGQPATAGDKMKPSLKLKEIRPLMLAYTEEFFLDGTARDNGGVKSVTVNGEELLSAGAAGAVQRYFSRSLPLDLGTNRFEVVATDMAGNRNEQAFTVIRKTPEYLDDEFRLAVGVSPLAAAEKTPQSDLVRRLVEQAILRDPIRFHLLERDERWWERILTEHQISASDLANPKAALKIGKVLPAELLIMAAFMGERGGFTVYAKVVEVATGKLRLADDVYCDETDTEVQFSVSGLVDKIQRRFPLLSGVVLSAAGEEATLNVGSNHGVEAGARFVVIRKAGDPPDIRSGEVRKHGDRFIELDVVRVKQDTAVAKVLPLVAGDKVVGGDYVYAR